MTTAGSVAGIAAAAATTGAETVDVDDLVAGVVVAEAAVDWEEDAAIGGVGLGSFNGDLIGVLLPLDGVPKEKKYSENQKTFREF